MSDQHIPDPVDWDEDHKAEKAPPLSPKRLKPIRDEVLLKRITDEITTESGIVLVTQAQSSRCQVVRLGDDVPLDYGIEPGDLVDVGGWEPGMREIKIDGEYFVFANYKNILYKVSS